MPSNITPDTPDTSDTTMAADTSIVAASQQPNHAPDSSPNNDVFPTDDAGDTPSRPGVFSTPAQQINGLPAVCVLGDGQLARMMHTAAGELGLSLRILSSDRNTPAGQIAAAAVPGDYTSRDDVLAAAAGCQVVTFEHEHVPSDVLAAVQQQGISVQPRPEALIYAQDKLAMRQTLGGMGLAVPQFTAITSVDDAHDFWDATGGHVCIKATRGGYDGQGVWLPDTREEMIAAVRVGLDKGIPLMGEEKIAWTRELSVLVARSTTGEMLCYPVTESVQRDGICVHAIAPAPKLSHDTVTAAHSIAQTIATHLDVTGVMAVELFEIPRGTSSTGDTLIINELAMRPHNTAHWTQDGCATSQFEQHLRAVAGLPLGPVHATGDVTVMANILGGEHPPTLTLQERMEQVWRAIPGAKIHLYGKQHRPGRKLGHVNLVGGTGDYVVDDARRAAHFMATGSWDMPA